MLHPVPARPPGPVDPQEAAGHVASALPGLDPHAATALALVALAGLERPEAAQRLQLDDEALAVALARARKQLRRELFPLPGSGWCERAERMISDRLDDVLTDPGPARLKAHLGNCARCVEHERRVVALQDGLVASFAESYPAPQPAAPLAMVEAPAAPALVPQAEPEPPRAAPEPAVLAPVAAPAPPAPRTASALAGGLAWGALAALAVLLAVASIALAVAGILGVG